MRLLFVMLLGFGVIQTTFASESQMKQEIELLKQQVEALTKLVQQQQAKPASVEKSLENKVEQLAERVEQNTQAVEDNSALASVAKKLSKVTIGGYGEHHLETIRDSEKDQVDAHRFVVYTGYQFNDKLSFQSELEVEHGLAGDGDDKPGEVELEQAYINYKPSDKTDVKLGQFLIPVGLINETHEPDTFYGVERPRFTSRIIPATWWETGAMVSGRVGEAVSYDVGVHSGLNVDNGAGGLDDIRNGRQKSAKASANDPAFTGRVDYSPVPGVSVGATANYQRDITQSSLTEVAVKDNVNALLTEVHADIQRGPIGVRAVYGKWDIDTDIKPVEDQDGYYIEGSYKVTPKLGVFARYSDMEYADDVVSSDVTTGYKSIDEENITLGANYWLHPQVVLKADYQLRETDTTEYDLTNAKTKTTKGKERDSVNLGIGWSF